MDKCGCGFTGFSKYPSRRTPPPRHFAPRGCPVDIHMPVGASGRGYQIRLLAMQASKPLDSTYLWFADAMPRY